MARSIPHPSTGGGCNVRSRKGGQGNHHHVCGELTHQLHTHTHLSRKTLVVQTITAVPRRRALSSMAIMLGLLLERRRSKNPVSLRVHPQPQHPAQPQTVSLVLQLAKRNPDKTQGRRSLPNSMCRVRLCKVCNGLPSTQQEKQMSLVRLALSRSR